MFLNHVGRLSANDPLLDVNQRFLEIVTQETGTFLYVATGQGGGLSAYRLSTGTDAPRLVDRAYYPDWMGGTGGDMLRHVPIDGVDQLVIGGARHRDEGPLLGYRIAPSGGIGEIVTTGSLIAPSWNVADVAVQGDTGTGALYVTDSGTGRLVSYLPQADGAYAPDSTQIGNPLGIAASIATVVSGDRQFVIATNSMQNAVQSFAVSATGSLRPVDTADASEGLPISGPTAMEIFEAFGNTWVVVAAAGSGSLSTLRLDGTGNLVPVDHFIDTLNTRFADVQTLAVAQSASRVFIVAGGGDDGLSLFTLLPNGYLLHLHSLAAETGTGLMNVEDVAMTILGDHLQIYVTSGAEAGISRFTLPVASLAPVLTDTGSGDATLTGTAGADLIRLGRDGMDVAHSGAGDDIVVAGGGGARLTGGAGADRFVIEEGRAPQEIRILDFTPGRDVLDLSDFGMLRSVRQLGFTGTGTGAEIRFRDTVILLTSATRERLSEADVFGEMVQAGFTWPDRVPLLRADAPPQTPGPAPAPPAAPDPVPPASPPPADPPPTNPPPANPPPANPAPPPDPPPAPAPPPAPPAPPPPSPGIARRGGEGDDVIVGGAGNDTLSGAGGNDRLSGLIGADEIWANEGNDTVLGGSGNDTVGGSTGEDRIYGEAGDDQIWGAGGNDRLWGGDGNDTAGGGDDSDTLYGGAGNDLVWGGNGADVQYGGIGNDTVGGFSGDDRLWGEDGDDEVWGNVGNDTGWAGEGDDTMGGAEGDDILYGENGDDLIGGGQDNDTLSGGNGDDTIRGRSGDDLIAGDRGQDKISGHGGNDRIWGGAGDDDLFGADGDDLVDGGWGNDTVLGGGGHDMLNGSRDNDTLIGGWGRDTLDGGEGDDLLSGEIGDDVFVFSGQHGFDRIQDFETGTDHIEIRGGGVTRFGQLDLAQSGDNVVLRLPGGTVVIESTSLSALDAGDFLFG